MFDRFDRLGVWSMACSASVCLVVLLLILANQAKLDKVLSNQATLLANQETIQENQTAIQENQRQILANQARIMEK